MAARAAANANDILGGWSPFKQKPQVHTEELEAERQRTLKNRIDPSTGLVNASSESSFTSEHRPWNRAES